MDRHLFLALTLSATLQCLAFTPTQATTFAVHLEALKGVANRGAFVKVAAQKSTTEADALFCVYTAALMNQIHQKTPIARIVMQLTWRRSASPPNATTCPALSGCYCYPWPVAACG